MDKLQPKYLVHGHVHKNYHTQQTGDLHHGETTIINACGYRILEIPDPDTQNGK